MPFIFGWKGCGGQSRLLCELLNSQVIQLRMSIKFFNNYWLSSIKKYFQSHSSDYLVSSYYVCHTLRWLLYTFSSVIKILLENRYYYTYCAGLVRLTKLNCFKASESEFELLYGLP